MQKRKDTIDSRIAANDEQRRKVQSRRLSSFLNNDDYLIIVHAVLYHPLSRSVFVHAPEVGGIVWRDVAWTNITAALAILIDRHAQYCYRGGLTRFYAPCHKPSRQHERNLITVVPPHANTRAAYKLIKQRHCSRY